MIRDLPWRAIQRTIHGLRRRWFTVSKPDHPSLQIDASVQEVADHLQSPANFEDGWIVSYQYHGEDANLRRPAGVETIDGEEVQMQLHIRLFEHTTHGEVWTELLAHREPSPIQHPRLHLTEVGFDTTGGLERAASVLGILGLQHSRGDADA